MAASRNRGNTGGNPRIMVAVTAAVIIVLVGLFLLNQAASKKDDGMKLLDDAPSTASQPMMGSGEAGVTIVEFGDYKCPSCKAWTERVWPQLKQDYIDSGKANFAYINVEFHGEESTLGAKAGEAVYQAYPDRFWDFHKALFDAQPGADHNSLWLTEEKLLDIAAETVPEMDKDAFLSALNGDSAASMAELDRILVRQYGVKATPTIMVNHIEIQDPFDYEAIRSAIEGELQP